MPGRSAGSLRRSPDTPGRRDEDRGGDQRVPQQAVTAAGHPAVGERPGIAVSARGRIPASVVEQYEAATTGR